MSSVDMGPRPPAAAYHIVADLLPDWYFHQRPVKRGRLFSVVGKDDNIATTWIIPDAMATPLEQQLRAHRSIRSVHVSKYVEPPKTKS